jgi:hypothetical protein
LTDSQNHSVGGSCSGRKAKIGKNQTRY